MILGIRLKLKLASLDLLWSDLFLQLLDAIVEHKLELFKLLSLTLQLVDLRLSVTNLSILLSDLLM